MRFGPPIAIVVWMTAAVMAGVVQAAPDEPDADPAAILEVLRSAELRPAAALAVDGVTLRFGPAELVVDRGTLVPASAVGDGPMEWVFIGEARFGLAAPDPIEADQLELFTGSPAIRERVDEMVLVVGDPSTLDALVDRPIRVPPDDVSARAEARYAAWKESPERRLQGAEAAMVRAALGDPPYRRYVGLWCRGATLGGFFFRLDPDEQEPVGVGQFVPFEAGAGGRRVVGWHLRSEQRRGRWVGVRFEDLGAWDVWTSSAARDADGVPIHGDPGVEPVRYTIDVTVDPGAERIDGVANLQLAVEQNGRRVVALDLHTDLEVRAVFDRLGSRLPHVRVGRQVLVALAAPTVQGDRIDLAVEYGGHLIRKTARREFVLRHTSLWYPRSGTLDRARYDLTLRWPRALDLVAPGRTVDGGVSAGIRWERRIVDVPGIAVSFELGRFVFERTRAGHLDVTVAFGKRIADDMGSRARRETVREVREALVYFQSLYGALPFNEFVVVTSPREFSQAFLGYMSVAESTFHADGAASWSARRPIRERTLAHEIAHQWWGNLVGWRSYRDQWLSEAMADHAALLYLDRDGAHRSEGYLAELAAGWRGSLGTRLRDGRTLESVGPLVLGERLNSSKAGEAYRAIVYRKGAAVLATLARTLGEGPFLAMNRALVDAARGHVLSTEVFLQSMERMSGRDLREFASTYVYGTGIPEVYYTYRIENDDADGWFVRGRATQSSSHDDRHRVIETTGGGWDVRRERVEHLDVATSDLLVPLRVELQPVEVAAEDRPRSRRRKREPEREPVVANLEGVVRVRGREQEFEIPVPGRPRRLEFDPRGEILANFHSESVAPKQVLHHLAQNVAGSGDHAQAEELYLRALGSTSEFDDRTTRLFDMRIRIDLARMFLDSDRDGDAIRELDRVERDLRPSDRSMFQVALALARSRVDLRAGNPREAGQRLGRLIGLLEPRSSFTTWWQYRLYLEIHTGTGTAAELAALYAVATRLTGDDDGFEKAAREASERGCDLSALDDVPRPPSR